MKPSGPSSAVTAPTSARPVVTGRVAVGPRRGSSDDCAASTTSATATVPIILVLTSPLLLRRPAIPAPWRAERLDVGEMPLDLPDQRLHVGGPQRLLHRRERARRGSRGTHTALTWSRLYSVLQPAMEIRLLGSLEVREGERTVALPRRQQRALLAALRCGWARLCRPSGSSQTSGASGRPRRRPARSRTPSRRCGRLGRDVVLTQAPGYRLALEPASVDAHRFERLLAAARGARRQRGRSS